MLLPRRQPSPAWSKTRALAELRLQLAGGGTLDTADYVVTGPAAFSRSGTDPFASQRDPLDHDSEVSGGTGYSITYHCGRRRLRYRLRGLYVFQRDRPWNRAGTGGATWPPGSPRQGGASVNGVIGLLSPTVDGTRRRRQRSSSALRSRSPRRRTTATPDPPRSPITGPRRGARSARPTPRTQR